MMFKEMLKLDREGEEQLDLDFDNSITNLPIELVIPTNPNEGHQDEPVDPVTV